MERFFFEKKHFFFIIYSNFSHVQSFLTFCPKNLMIGSEMTFLRNNSIWYAFYSKFATLRDFEKLEVLFSKNHQFFPKKTQILNVLRILTIWVKFYGIFATLGEFEKIQDFFSKNLSIFFEKKPKFWKFWKFFLFQSKSTPNLLLLPIWKIQVFSRKNHLFFQKRPKFRTFWGILLFQAQSTANLLQFRHVQRREYTCRCGVNAIGKLRVKDRRKWPIWVEDFAFMFLRIWRKISITNDK